MGLSTHVLDTGLGRPAAGVTLVLSRRTHEGWGEIGGGITDADGRCRSLLGDKELDATVYRLRFEITPYLAAQALVSLYPFIEIVFQVTDPQQHHHIPLLLAANGFTTYRGS